MTKKQLRSLIGVLVTLLIAWFWRDPSLPIEPVVSDKEELSIEEPIIYPASTSTVVLANARVVRVVDGDTVEALWDNASTTAKIRLLGVNTPESVDPRRPVECFGKEASQFLKDLIEGKRVRLEEDAQADDRDKYDRWLRNIFLEDGTDVNARLVEEGYAHAYVSFPLNKQRKNQLSRLQEEAKAAKRGLWNPETCDGMK